MITNKKNPIHYINSVVPKEYHPNDLYILVENETQNILSTYETPYNFIRYYWREHLKYNFMSDGYKDPVTYLYYKVNDLSSDISRAQLEKTLSENNGKKGINDLAFIWILEHSILNNGCSFCRIENMDQKKIAIFLNGCGISNIPDVLENIIKNSNNQEVYKQSTWLRS